jgi:hypothetical protein
MQRSLYLETYVYASFRAWKRLGVESHIGYFGYLGYCDYIYCHIYHDYSGYIGCRGCMGNDQPLKQLTSVMPFAKGKGQILANAPESLHYVHIS